MRFILLLSIFIGISSCHSNQNNENSVNNNVESAVVVDRESASIPAMAQDLINEHFNKENISKVIKKDPIESDSIAYEVTLENQTQIDFDKNGNWIEVEGANNRPIPSMYVDKNILRYTSSKYPNSAFLSVKRTNTGYEIELSNDVELHFDLQGQFLRMEK